LETKTEEFKRVTAELAQVKAPRKEDGELTALNDKVTGLSERNRTLKRDLSEYKVQLASTLEECKLRDRANKESARRVEEQNCRISFLQRQLEEAMTADEVARLAQQLGFSVSGSEILRFSGQSAAGVRVRRIDHPGEYPGRYY
jgi:predicted RNase H-like nuclease (RuvC/YqgF family)